MHNILDDLKLNFDPDAPQKRFVEAGFAAAAMTPEQLLPASVPWPEGQAPAPLRLDPLPVETDDLSRFAGYDAVVITWTSAEASALAALLTPNAPLSNWFEYRPNQSAGSAGLDAYIPLVTGRDAPFNDRKVPRYYHSLGLYFPVQIGSARVLLFKSGLHLDYDGRDVPVKQLIAEIANTVTPKTLITTGTGGGIGVDVHLGDVVIAAFTRFDCTTQFQDETWCNLALNTSPLPSGAIQAITPNLLSVNASRLPNGSQNPTIWASAADGVVTTDLFGFDDSTDHYHLQGKGTACDMGDAMVGYALQDVPHLKWYSVRNASDPQISNPDDDMKSASRQAAEIYSQYGGITTAASVISAWAIIVAQFS